LGNAVWQSKNVSITNFFVNATSNNQWDTTNTDVYDSWKSDMLLVENVTIINGDDCVAVKGDFQWPLGTYIP
jgi:polygalacturonase